MSFNSYPFLFAFLPMAVAGFWLLARYSSHNGAVGWLILVSVAFHACAGWKSLLIILASILLTYFFIRSLLRIDPNKVSLRRWVFSAGVTADLALLCYFKYQNFFQDTASTMFGTHFELGTMALPLGISFLTFQKIALQADVYAGQIKQVNVTDYALFTLFFPRAVSGPIVRYEEIVPQFANIGHTTIATNAPVAACLFAIGLFKKTVIGDSLAELANPVFATDDPFPRSFLTAWSGALAYTLQLYFDFSGYSDMALGAALLFGVRLPANFYSPLRACSIIEFWSCWHITLTRFLTAYIYTPVVLYLTRTRVSKGKSVLRGKRSTLPAVLMLVAMPTLITMVVSGIWHGAGWQFIIWGLLHGIYLTINQSWRMLRPRFWADHGSHERLMRPIGWVLTFGSVVVAMVFFRANSVDQALNILGAMFGANGILPHDLQLLRDLGVNIVGATWSAQPFQAFVWIVILLALVLVLPNSLELLRRFEPALDFQERYAVASASDPPTARLNAGRLSTGLYSAWIILKRCRRDGVRLTWLTAAVAALLWVLGAMAISSSEAFIYGQF